MSKITELSESIKGLATKAAETVADTSLSQAEKAERLDGIENDIRVKSIERQAAATDEADTKGIADRRAELEEAGESHEAPTRETRTIGRQFIESDAFKALGGDFKGKRFSSGSVAVKATMSLTASDVASPQTIPGVQTINAQPITIEALLASGTTNASEVRYLKETTATNAAAAVAEEGTKPESTLILGEVSDPVRKVATVLKVTDEMLEDLDAVESYLTARGTLFIGQEVEDQLLNGSGTAPNVLGLRNRSGIATDVAMGTDTAVDAIYKQITAIRIGAFVEPDGIVVNPADWQDIRLSKDTNGQYYAGGPFMGAYGGAGGIASDFLWGKPVVVTTAIPAGTALVGAFATQAQVFNRTGLTIESTNSDQDDFIKNRVTFRFERRLALAVYRPGAFGEVTGI